MMASPSQRSAITDDFEVAYAVQTTIQWPDEHPRVTCNAADLNLDQAKSFLDQRWRDLKASGWQVIPPHEHQADEFEYYGGTLRRRVAPNCGQSCCRSRFEYLTLEVVLNA